jgi:hypothetical protein
MLGSRIVSLDDRDPFDRFYHARALTADEVRRANELGRLLEDQVGSALELLKSLGHIKDYRDLRPIVEIYTKLNRAHGLPDFWVLLTNKCEVNIEVKNLGFNMKKYVKSPSDTPFWAYDSRWWKENLNKAWTDGAKKILVVSTLKSTWYRAAEWLHGFLDGIVEVGNVQVEKASGGDRDHIAIQLYQLFERWIKE